MRWSGSVWLRRVCVAASALGLVYGLYRAYYALGGTVGMIGEPASHAQWVAINAAGAIAILVAAGVPLAALGLWRVPAARLVLLVLFSVAAIGMVMHALVDEGQRVLNLSGLAAAWHVELASDSMAGWVWKDQRRADIQDMVVNEPWFLLEGVLCGAVVWLVLGRGRARRLWLGGAVLAVLLLTGYGLLSAVGVFGRSIVL